MEVKYRYLGVKGSTLQIRFLLIVLMIIGILLIVSYFFDDEGELVQIFLGSYVLFVVYLLSFLNTVKYNTNDIIVQNWKGKHVYTKQDFLSLGPLRRYLNLYTITFKNNQSYIFGLSSSKFLFSDNTIENASLLRNELFLDREW